MVYCAYAGAPLVWFQERKMKKTVVGILAVTAMGFTVSSIGLGVDGDVKAVKQ